MSGRDMMGIAQTGTGKTFAIYPLIKIIQISSWTYSKIVTLSYALVVQVVEEVEKLTKYMSVCTVNGGVNITSKKQRYTKVATFL
jgi:ATP-dependent RNA helicase RhlE